MLGVLCAMEVEAKGLIALMDRKSEKSMIGYDFTSGYIGDKEIVVALSGIGKGYAAAATALLISHFDVTEVINLGICGGSVGVGKLIVADSVVQYDFDTTAFGDELGKLDGFDSPYIACSDMRKRIRGDLGGVIASGDKFIAGEEEADRLAKRFGAVGFDMESGAVAQICSKAKVDFAIVRVVSDGGDATEYEKFKAEAAKKGVNAVMEYLDRPYSD